MTLLERVLYEADKTRFIRDIWNSNREKAKEYEGLTPGGQTPDEFEREYPTADEVIKWANSGAADSLRIDWPKLQKGDENEFRKFFKGYMDWKERGTYKSRHSSSNLFNDTEKFYVLPIENKNWLFVCPRNWEACKLIDSAVYGGSGARWCIGWEESDEYWRKYLAQGDRFVLAFRKKGAPQNITEDDYDDNPGDVCPKYMIQLKYWDDENDTSSNPDSLRPNDAAAWRPCDSPYDTIKHPTTFKEIFGVEVSELLSKTDNWHDIVNDFGAWPVTFEEFMEGKWVPAKKDQVVEFSDKSIESLDLAKIIKMYGDKLYEVKFANFDIKDLYMNTSELSDETKTLFYFVDCTIDTLAAEPLGYAYSMSIFSSDINHAVYNGVQEYIQEEDVDEEEAMYILYEDNDNFDLRQCRIQHEIIN